MVVDGGKCLQCHAALPQLTVCFYQVHGTFKDQCCRIQSRLSTLSRSRTSLLALVFSFCELSQLVSNGTASPLGLRLGATSVAYLVLLTSSERSRMTSKLSQQSQVLCCDVRFIRSFIAPRTYLCWAAPSYTFVFSIQVIRRRSGGEILLLRN